MRNPWRQPTPIGKDSEPGDDDEGQPKRSLVPETSNTKIEDDKVSGAIATAAATSYSGDDGGSDNDDDNDESKRSNVPEVDKFEIENDEVHVGYNAEKEKEGKEEDRFSDDDDDDDNDDGVREQEKDEDKNDEDD